MLDSPSATAKILDAIEALLAQGEVVYVRCWGGVGRMGMIVGCRLTRHGYQARRCWPCCVSSGSSVRSPATVRSPEMWEQKQYVVSWSE